MVTSTENPSEEEEIFTNSFKIQQQNNQKRIGIIGFGRLGRYLYFLKVTGKIIF